MKKFVGIKKYVVLQKKLNLFVAESHYFDAKGRRQLTLTDTEKYAEQMTLEEANKFIASVDANKFVILEASEDFDDEEVEADE